MRPPLLAALLLACATVLAPAVPAQHHACSTLTVHGSGHPGTNLTLAMTGAAAHAPALLALSAHEGSTMIHLGPLGTLSLGLAEPLHFLAMGITDAHGDVSITLQVPAHVPHPARHFAQSFTVVLVGHPHHPPQLEFCTANVVSFGVGR